MGRPETILFQPSIFVEDVSFREGNPIHGLVSKYKGPLDPLNASIAGLMASTPPKN